MKKMIFLVLILLSIGLMSCAYLLPLLPILASESAQSTQSSSSSTRSIQGNTREQPIELILGTEITRNQDWREDHWYVFNSNYTGIVRVQLIATGVPSLYAYDQNNHQISHAYGRNPQMMISVETENTYYFRLSEYSSGSYRIIALDPMQSQELFIGTEIQGNLDIGEEHLFVFHANNTGSLRIVTSGGSDTFLEVYDQNNRLIRSNMTGAGIMSRYNVTLVISVETGFSYIFSFRVLDRGTSGTYQITVHDEDERQRQQEEARIQREEETRRQQEEARLQQEETRRQQEEVRRQQEEVRRQQEEARRLAEQQARQAEQNRLADLYRQAGQSIGNLRNTTWSYVGQRGDLVVTERYDFGDGNYIYEMRLDLTVVWRTERGTFRVLGNNVIFLSENQYSLGNIIGNTIEVNRNIFRRTN